MAVTAAFLVPPDTYTHLRLGRDLGALLLRQLALHRHQVQLLRTDRPGLALTHTWSLAVEEQFYLIWPLIVLGVFKVWRSTRVLLVVCLVGAVASALEMALLYSSSNVNRVYYGTDTRAQSLLIGAALAVALSMWADRRRQSGPEVDDHRRAHRRLGGDPAWAARTDRGRHLVLAVGLAGVAGCVALWTTINYNDPLAFRGGFFLAALATSAVLFSVVCSQRSVLAVALSFSPLRYVGRISYGLYLWHYPLFLYIDNARTGLTGYPLFVVRVAATLVIATASFYLMERPIRQRNFLKGWQGWRGHTGGGGGRGGGPLRRHHHPVGGRRPHAAGGRRSVESGRRRPVQGAAGR